MSLSDILSVVSLCELVEMGRFGRTAILGAKRETGRGERNSQEGTAPSQNATSKVERGPNKAEEADTLSPEATWVDVGLRVVDNVPRLEKMSGQLHRAPSLVCGGQEGQGNLGKS